MAAEPDRSVSSWNPFQRIETPAQAIAATRLSRPVGNSLKAILWVLLAVLLVGFLLQLPNALDVTRAIAGVAMMLAAALVIAACVWSIRHAQRNLPGKNPYRGSQVLTLWFALACLCWLMAVHLMIPNASVILAVSAVLLTILSLPVIVMVRGALKLHELQTGADTYPYDELDLFLPKEMDDPAADVLRMVAYLGLLSIVSQLWQIAFLAWIGQDVLGLSVPEATMLHGLVLFVLPILALLAYWKQSWLLSLLTAAISGVSFGLSFMSLASVSTKPPSFSSGLPVIAASALVLSFVAARKLIWIRVKGKEFSTMRRT